MMLLERETELEDLDSLLADLNAAGGKVVLIRGEAGIGKSALTSEFVSRHRDDAHIMWGSCDDLLTPQALGPFRDIARHEPSLKDHLDAGERSGVLHATLDLLSRSLRPTILVLEDTHWADEATLDSIKFLGRRIARTNSLMLLTFRENVVDLNHPLRAVFADLPPASVKRIRLSGLTLEAVSTLLSKSPLDPREAWEVTNGNPFFVTEMASVTRGEVPRSVRDSVMARTRTLTKKARRGVQLLSVIPERIPRTTALALTGVGSDELEECQRVGLIQIGPEFVTFRHELTRRAIESSLTIKEQVAANRAVLNSLHPEADPATFVHHARGAVDVEAILKYGPKAARSASAIGSHREAAAHFETLGPHLDRLGLEDQAAILEAWGLNQDTLGSQNAILLLERAVKIRREVGDQGPLAEALTLIVNPYQANSLPQGALDASDESIRILEDLGSTSALASALAARAFLSLLQGDSEDETVEIADRTILLAEKTANIPALAIAKQAKGVILASRGRADGNKLVEQAMHHARDLSDKRREVSALATLASLEADFRRLGPALALTRRGIAKADEFQLVGLGGYLLAMQAEVRLWLGEWTKAEDEAQELLTALPNSEFIARRVLGVMYSRQGRTEAASSIERMWEISEESGEHMSFDSSAAALAEHLWITGKSDPQLIERLREIVDQGLREGNPWPSGALSFWMKKLGELPVIPDSVIGPFQQSLEGNHLEAALLWDDIGSPYEAAMARTHLGELEQLKALEVFERLGATAVAAKHRKAMRDQGFSVPRGKGMHTRTNVAGLTARQSEVVALLADGLTNREIADRLFVSPRTVEHHVSAILSKLNATSRAEAVERASEAGVLRA